MRLARALGALAARLPVRTIDHYGDIYLARFRLASLGRLARAYLHRFVRPDVDPEHHSHPWPFAISIVLTGRVVVRERRPGAIHVLRRSTYHRVATLGPGPVWTLFIPFGKNDDQWYFKNPETGEVTPWRVFVERQGRRIA